MSFPARPVNGGNLVLSGVREDWLYQPKINGWRAVYCSLTGQAWNRHGSPLSIPLPEAGCRELHRIAEKAGCDWWDLELVERRTKLKGVIIILDVMDCALPFNKRYQKIQSLVPAVGFDGKWKPLSTLSAVSSSGAEELWLGGLAYNKKHGDELYEGVVGKKAGSPYPIQKTSASRCFPYWMKHRYAD